MEESKVEAAAVVRWDGKTVAVGGAMWRLGRCGVCEWRKVGRCGGWCSGGVFGWWRCPRGWGERYVVFDDSSIGGGVCECEGARDGGGK